jgi:hypothetical protein
VSNGSTRYGTVICVLAGAPLPHALVATTVMAYVPAPAVPDKLKPVVGNVAVNAPPTMTRYPVAAAPLNGGAHDTVT